MYEERKNDFSLRTLILQILFVVLFVFILLWLFPTKNYVKDYVDNTFTDKLQPLYSQIYSQNLTTMKEAAISYFTTDRLPSKVGDSVTMTLKEMQDKKIVLDLIDSNNNKCNVTESYVKVVKEKNEYIMTVNLSCSDTSDYINVYLGCYDYCEASGVCEKKDTPTPTSPVKPVTSKKYEYEYEKITDGKWGNWSNWSEWSLDAATKTEYRNVETKDVTVQTGSKLEVINATASTKTTYSCPAGYTLSGTKCNKKTTATVTATSSVTYGEWIYNGQYTYKNIQSSTNTRKVVRVSSSVNTNCTTNCTGNTYTYLVYTRSAKTTYSCPTGYKLSGTSCSKATTSTINATANTNNNTTYSCKSGYTLSGTKCSKSVAVYTTYTYYRVQTREFISGSKDVKWSLSRNDTTLTKQGYVLTGNKREAK